MVKKKRHNTAKAPDHLKRYLLAFYAAGAIILVILKYFGLIWPEIIIAGSFIGVTGLAGYLIMRLLEWFNQLEVRNQTSSRPSSAAIKPGSTWLTTSAVIGLFAIVGIGASIWAYRTYPTPFPPEKADQIIREINPQLTYLEIKQSQLIFKQDTRAAKLKSQASLFGCGDKPQAQFVISLNSKYLNSTYLFNAYEYTIETGGDTTELPVNDVCEFINQYDGKSPLLEVIKRVPIDYSVPIGASGLKLSLKGLAIELGYIFIKLKRVTGRPCLEVLVKGYADGQMGPWERRLLPNKYHYQNIAVYPRFDSLSKNPFEYVRSTRTYTVPENYSNSNLPNLRAMFVKEDLVTPFVSKCDELKGVSVNILDGYELSAWNPMERKVQVYVMVY